MEVSCQITREMEDVGISPDMIRSHHQYITNWIKDVVGTSKLNESAQSTTTDHSLPREYQAATKIILFLMQSRTETVKLKNLDSQLPRLELSKL